MIVRIIVTADKGMGDSTVADENENLHLLFASVDHW